MPRLSVSLSEATYNALHDKAVADRRSDSGMAALLLDGALTEGEERPLDSARGGCGATAPGAVASTALSPSVSVPDIPGVVRGSQIKAPRPANVDENGEIVDVTAERFEEAP